MYKFGGQSVRIWFKVCFSGEDGVRIWGRRAFGFLDCKHSFKTTTYKILKYDGWKVGVRLWGAKCTSMGKIDLAGI